MKYFFIKIFFGKIIFFFYIIVFIKPGSQIYLEENMVIFADNSIYKQSQLAFLFFCINRDIIYKPCYSTFLIASRSFRAPPYISLFEFNLNKNSIVI